MTDKRKRKETIEQRLQRMEDMFEIYQLITAYGPSVDSGSAREAAELWTEDGSYEIPGIGSFPGHAGIIGMLEGELHQTLIHGGCAHIISMPHVTLDGDRAVATNYGRVYVRKEDGFGLFRVIATRWELARTDEGWKCVTRINELLDGRPEARALLARGVAESRAAFAK